MLAVCVLALLHSAVETNAFVAPGLHSLQPSLQHAQTTRPHARFLPALDRRQRSSTTFQLLATAAAEPIVIEPVSKKDVNRLRDVAAFFVDAFFQDYKAEATLSRTQLKRLGDEQFADMRQRYGEYIPLPSAMLVATSGNDILGCAGLEIALISENNKIMPKSRMNIEAGYTPRPLLANLAVSPLARRRGLARQLCLAGEAEVLSWGYTELLLLVESENTPALKLYRSLGYTEVWRDETAIASKAIPYAGTTALQKVQVCNVAMRKDLTAKRGGLFGLFGL